MPKALIIAASKSPMRASDANPTDDYREPVAGEGAGDETPDEESAEESAKYSVEVPLEGEEIAATAPEGVDLAAVPQTGRALVEYSLQCEPDGSACRIILGKICFAGGGEVGDTEDDGGEIEEGGDEARPGFTLGGKGIAALLAKSVERNRG